MPVMMMKILTSWEVVVLSVNFMLKEALDSFTAYGCSSLNVISNTATKIYICKLAYSLLATINFKYTPVHKETTILSHNRL